MGTGHCQKVGTRTPTTNTLKPLFGVKKSFGTTLHNTVNAATEPYRLGNGYGKLIHVSPAFFFPQKATPLQSSSALIKHSTQGYHRSRTKG